MHITDIFETVDNLRVYRTKGCQVNFLEIMIKYMMLCQKFVPVFFWMFVYHIWPCINEMILVSFCHNLRNII